MVMTPLEKKLGHTFANKKLLTQALTHPSLGGQNYERLEFLGDRVLSLIMAHALIELFPNESEGGIAKRHAALVSGETLAAIASILGVSDGVTISAKDRSTGLSEQENLLADVLEALIGAIYLDAGLEACRPVIASLWGDRLKTMTSPPADPKTELQEWAQSRGLAVPVYEVASRDGPDHAPHFTVRVTVSGHPPATSTGSSKRIGEKRAAAALLEQIRSKS